MGNLLGNLKEVRHLDSVVLKEASGSRASRKSYCVLNAQVLRNNPVRINSNTTPISQNVTEKEPRKLGKSLKYYYIVQRSTVV